MTVINEPITLARALKIKKRVESRLHRLSNDVMDNNSIVKGATREVDVKEKLQEYNRVAKILLDLRVAIWKDSLPIQPLILEINEVKSLIALIARMSTVHGVQRPSRYDSESGPATYEATFRKADVDAMTEESEARIDTLQEQIDSHNATVKIRVEGLEV